MMIVCFSRAPFLFCSWRWKLRKAGIIEVNCHSTMTETINKINLISKWFVMIVSSWSVWRTVFRSCLGMAWSSSLEEMLCNSDLYVYLNIEVVIGLFQWSPLLRSQVILQIFWVVIVSGISVVGCVQPFCGLSVMRSFLFLDARLCDFVWSILLHYIIYINECLVSSSFSYDFLLVFIAKAFILVQLF